MILFNDLLAREAIPAERILLVRHKPDVPRLAAVLRNAILTEPALLEAYQASQDLRFERRLRGIDHLASFIEDGTGRALFVGIYTYAGAERIGAERWNADPLNQRLLAAGMRPWAGRDREEALRLSLTAAPMLGHLSGRLVVEWVTLGRHWLHRASERELAVLAIHERSAFDPPPPPWDQWVLCWDELATLPPRQRDRLAEWRGVYLIYDEPSGRAYVGSASGEENLLGRWRNYRETGHGGNVLLRALDPSGFRFSILQRVSPDMPPDEVVAIEANWKRRLHTIGGNGLNAN